MKLRKIISTAIKDFINENRDNVDQLLDKINKDGKQSLTYDERTYLEQFSDNNIDPGLEEWIFGDDDRTYDVDGNKLLYDEYTSDEEILEKERITLLLVAENAVSSEELGRIAKTCLLLGRRLKVIPEGFHFWLDGRPPELIS